MDNVIRTFLVLFCSSWHLHVTPVTHTSLDNRQNRPLQLSESCVIEKLRVIFTL